MKTYGYMKHYVRRGWRATVAGCWHATNRWGWRAMAVGGLCLALAACGSRAGKTEVETDSVQAVTDMNWADTVAVDTAGAVGANVQGLEIESIKEEVPGTNTPKVEYEPEPLSDFYEEGYDAGYADGEDDAICHNGWHGQYDDDCDYHGQARHDYVEGYDDGYEAGYDDNLDYDD